MSVILAECVEMIDYNKLKLGMLNDKHIDQWAGYLIQELPNCRELEQDNELCEILISMYKKGYEDCIEYIQKGERAND